MSFWTHLSDEGVVVYWLWRWELVSWRSIRFVSPAPHMPLSGVHDGDPSWLVIIVDEYHLNSFKVTFHEPLDYVLILYLYLCA